jgi:trimeric autotransporter adhesin
MRTRAPFLLAVFVTFASASALLAQGFQGGLRGSIKDAGGVIPGVEVTLTSEATNISRTTSTNERGEYVFASVTPGTYSVKATLTGYKTIDRRAIPIGTQQFITLDLTLEVGRLEESVTVTGQSPIVETSNASQGTVLNSEALQTLPSPGRAAFLIGASVPTVVPSGDAQFNRQQDQTNASLLSLGGGTRRGNNYTLDGVPITDLTNRAVANPTIESLEDVKVQVHTYDAEMGRTGGGVFNTTLKSGTNAWRGTAFFQTRPVWGAANNYFSQKALENCRAGDTNCVNLNRKQDTKWYTPGAGFGGPIKKDRAFFWFATEDYHNISTRNSPGIVLPTAAERRGDFSQTRSGNAPVIIFDPLTRQPFPGNQIPASRINPIAAKILSYVPLPQRDVDDGASNYSSQAVLNDKFQQLYSVKLEQKLTEKVSLTGFYLYNRTDEPCANYMAGQDDPNRFIDTADYILKRRPQILALNNTWVLSNSSVMALRFGWTRFPDNPSLSIDYDPAQLGFASSFLGLIDQTGVPKFPIIDFQTTYRDYGHQDPVKDRVYESWGTNGVFSKFVGTHTFKVGADYRRIGALLDGTSCPSGCFVFGREFTSSTGLNNGSATDGNAFATFLLGFPSGDFQASGGDTPTRMRLSTPLDLYTNYFGGYVQDDWRVSSNFTVNYGVRIEHEDGMREANNNFTVGFDRTSASPVNITIPANIDPTGATAARQVRGGLKFAGVNGNPTQQGDPPAAKFSPRLGAVYSLNTKTVLRAGYGMYWAPWTYPAPSPASYGAIGFSNDTSAPQTTVTPTVSMTNPFPNGLVGPSGNSLGLLAGAGTNINFVDETRKAPRVQQYTVDLQRELGGDMAVHVSYVGARGDHLPLGGTNNTAININQLDPKYLALGSAVLAQSVPNPFFGNPAFKGTALGNLATTNRGQLLRPFPQFGNISMFQVSEGVNRYDAAVVELSRRMSRGWGGRFSYTYSVLKDNQVGETNFYTNPGTSGAMNNYNYDASLPACDGALSRVQRYSAMCFDPLVDYGAGVLDTPHRFVVAPMVALPFGKDHKIGKSGIGNVFAGGWTAAAVFTWQSGFPIGVSQSNSTSNLLGNNQRPNLVPGVDTSTPGNWPERVASADHPSAAWLNLAAFAPAAAGTFGDAPRLITSTRTPIQTQTDLSVAKNVGLGGGKQAQIKIEIVNLFNRVQLRGNQMNTTQGNSAFGTIVSQGGFMRLMQVMFRYSF